MNQKYIQACAEGFVHMSNKTYNCVFNDNCNREYIHDQLNDLSNRLKNIDMECGGCGHLDDLSIDCKFNDTCAHGHRKCCIRISVDVKTKNTDAHKVALYIVQKSASLVSDFILDTDMEVQIHRVRLMSAKNIDGESWIRPDNFDPKKGPRIHGC